MQSILLIFIFDTSNIALNYDFVWGASPSRVPNYRYGNPNIILSSYIPLNRDPNATHSLTYWRYFHPDWVLYQCDKVTPVKVLDDPNIGLDISNPAVRAWQVMEYAVEASKKGFSMLAIDNVHFENFYGACGVWRDSTTWVQLYSGAYSDDKFRNDTLLWLNEMKASLEGLNPPLGMALNYRPDFLGGTPSSIGQERNDILRVADAVVDGGSFTNFGHSFVNETVWLETIKFMITTQERRKAYFTINQFGAVAPNVIDWVLASYLMGKGKSAAVYITTIDNETGKPNFGGVQWYYEFGAQIGSPVNSVYKFEGVYRRDYSNGLVLVNHGKAITVTLPSLLYTLRGESVDGNVTLDTHSGIVLLSNFIVRDPVGSSANSLYMTLSYGALLLLCLML